MVDPQEIATIAAQNKKLASAFKARDMATLGGMYANDAVILPPGGNIIMGKGNIQSFWEQRIGEMEDVNFQTISVSPLGTDAAREIGTFQMTMAVDRQPGEEQGGPQTRSSSVKYVFIWQKTDGEWKVAACIWNRMGARQKPGTGVPGMRSVRQFRGGGG